MGFGITYQLEDTASERSRRKRMRLAGELRNVCPHIHDLRPTSDENGESALAVRWAIRDLCRHAVLLLHDLRVGVVAAQR